ncbi:MFS Git1p-related glycerophosphoinositol and glycerophosphocholine permease [Rhodocollybia butyracea]|uniref:MFS Git1p-related glycerophosphoinositol and glycerophosphocholine permease n=1 Tax=Rhodocollybia butyracea TaxID=206335 RepID=A0A9P5PFT5_9AGAR|nr:MFS Git1p-related glycerophosphoinositol and glycerophosphocholine permease [Rhodocollybia butyracea]
MEQEKKSVGSKLKSVSLIFACGTALFSDGYANGVISDINLILNRIYDNELTNHKYTNVISSLVFAGTVVGMVTFGWLSDKVGRKFGMMTATWIVAFFSLLSAASSGAHHSLPGLVAMLGVCRFLLGIGVGAEYPCGSVSASERTEEKDIAKMSQHRWFALATNCMIDFGFVVSSFVPLVLFWIFGENHLRAVWRLSLGLGVVPAIAVLIWRIGMKEPQRYQKDSMKYAKIPYSLVFRRYWKSLAAVSTVWFIYDFIVYPFGIFSSTVINNITGGNESLTVVMGWNVVINLFYMPGTIGGAFIVDYLGPKWTLIIGLLSQAVVGFIMSGLYKQLTDHIAAFAVLYGIFLSLGELGPGNCTGLLASKTSATAVRGQFYGIAAATGKVGAFIGTWVFPQIIIDFGGASTTKGNTGPFWIASGLAVLSAIITYFFIQPIHTDGMAEEDAKFREYLEANGYDTSQMGLRSEESSVVEYTEDVKEDVSTEAAV